MHTWLADHGCYCYAVYHGHQIPCWSVLIAIGIAQNNNHYLRNRLDNKNLRCILSSATWSCTLHLVNPLISTPVRKWTFYIGNILCTGIVCAERFYVFEERTRNFRLLYERMDKYIESVLIFQLQACLWFRPTKTLEMPYIKWVWE